jgi:hypothetical protein
VIPGEPESDPVSIAGVALVCDALRGVLRDGVASVGAGLGGVAPAGASGPSAARLPGDTARATAAAIRTERVGIIDDFMVGLYVIDLVKIGFQLEIKNLITNCV